MEPGPLGPGACCGAALKVLKREGVDLLLTDILMPDVDGIELIMQVRQTYPDLKVLAMSGEGAPRRMC